MAKATESRGVVLELICDFLQRTNEFENLAKRMKKKGGAVS